MKFELTKFYLSLLLFVFSEGRHKNYGGKIARDGQFPFVVSLSYQGQQRYCGSSIIHRRWLLTAAHCLFEDDEVNSDITQETEIKIGFNNYKIDKIYKHPDFIDIPEDENDGLEYIINDVGLIRLTSDITFNEKVQPITLATKDDGSYENSMATLPGWGRISYRQRSHDLRYINVRVLTRKECQKVWTYADKHICTSTQEKRGVCYVSPYDPKFMGDRDVLNKKFVPYLNDVLQGDSGSPLVVGEIQIGITSTADTYCQSLKPDLYTKVASFVPWIKSIMSQHGDVLPDLNLVEPRN